MACGSPASHRWGRREFGWSQRLRHCSEVVGGYVSRPDPTCLHGASFAVSAKTACSCTTSCRSDAEHRVVQRELPLGAWPEARREAEIVRRVATAPERSEAVDG